MSSVLSSPATAEPVRATALRASARALLVLTAALVSLAVQIKFIPIIGMGQGFETLSIARSLFTHGTFADPFDEPTGPTAHVAPLYPLFLAGIHRLSPDEEYFRIATLCMTLLVHLLNVWLLYLLAVDLFHGSSGGVVALLLVLALPLYEVVPAWDTIYISAAIPAFWLLARRRNVVAASVFGGMLLLLNPSLLLILLPIMISEWKQKNLVSLFLAIALLITVPWEVRNYRTFHKFFFIRDNLGLELDLYNNDCAAFGSGNCTPHPVNSAAERRLVRDMGEVPYNDMRMHRAVTWFETHPRAALRLIRHRIAEFWFPFSTHPPYGWCVALLTLASLWGFWCMYRDRVREIWPMLAIAAFYPIVYYLVGSSLRYRCPILLVSLLSAAYGLQSLWNLRHDAHSPE